MEENDIVEAVSNAIRGYLRDPAMVDQATLDVIEAVSACLDAPPSEDEVKRATAAVMADLRRYSWSSGINFPSWPSDFAPDVNTSDFGKVTIRRKN